MQNRVDVMEMVRWLSSTNGGFMLFFYKHFWWLFIGMLWGISSKSIRTTFVACNSLSIDYWIWCLYREKWATVCGKFSLGANFRDFRRETCFRENKKKRKKKCTKVEADDVITCVRSPVPRISVGGERESRYPLFAHALNLPEIMVNRKLLCYIRITVTINVYLPLHCPHTFWPTMEAFRSFVLLRSPAPSSSLRRLGTSDTSLKKVQVANRFGVCLENTATAW